MPFWTSSGVLELRDYVPRLTHTPLSAAAPRGSPRCRIAAHHGLGRRVGERVLAGRADAPLLHVRVRRRRRGAAHALRRPLRQLHHAPIFLLRALFLMPALCPVRLLAGPAAVERRDPALIARPVHGGSSGRAGRSRTTRSCFDRTPCARGIQDGPSTRTAPCAVR